MKTLNLLISSKNKKSLNNFFNFLDKNFLIMKFNFIEKKFHKKLKKTKITILKSPHVNKTAQEQFEIKYLAKQIKISTSNLPLFLIFLKKLKTHIFPDINIKIKFTHNKNTNNFNNKKIFNIDNFYNFFFFEKLYYIQNNKLKKNKLILFNNINKTLIKSINSQKMLKLFDIFGKY